MKLHPDAVLFDKEKPLPVLPAVDHYAGSEKLIGKALVLQAETGPVFDVTCDCEDGAATGEETAHAAMIVDMLHGALNRFDRAGARIHDITHHHWKQDIDILVGGAGARLPYLTLPKPRSADDVAVQLGYLREVEQRHDLQRRIPAHVLIETHGALREIWQIASLPGIESLDFGLMDFVSAHHGAIPGSAMKSPGQFTHPLITRAKTELCAAALANGLIPTHNVTTELQDIEYICQDASTARTHFGFLRMWSIHPKQIAPILEAMRPDFTEVIEAAEILAAAQAAAWGPIRHAGKLHDRASYRYYWELLQRAHATGVALPPEVLRRYFS